MPPGDASREVASAVEAAVGDAHPDVEVWDVVVIPRQELVRVLIERPGGVDVDTCAAVTRSLAEFREDYALEVSSPGLARDLTRPWHYGRVVGSTVKVRLQEPIDGRRSLEGELVEAGSDAIVVATDGGPVDIPIPLISKSNVVWNPVKSR